MDNAGDPIATLSSFPVDTPTVNVHRSVRVALLASLMMATTLSIAAETESKKRKKKKGRSPVASVLRQLKQNEIELTSEQTEKIGAMGTEAKPKMAEIREQHDLSPEFEKKVAAARQEARQMNKKGKEIDAHAMQSVGASDEQKEGLAKIAKLQMELLRSALGTLTEEQREKLPKRLSRVLNADQEA